MATIEAIASAVELIEVKKQTLKKAFDNLRDHSSSLSSSNFTLTWSDLDSYFSSLQSSLLHQFHHLQHSLHKLPKSPPPQSQSLNNPPLFSSEITENPSDSIQARPMFKSFSNVAKNPSDLVQAGPELKSFCEKLDGLGLRNFIISRPRERQSIRVELLDAFLQSSDPGTTVLNAMDGFYDPYLDPNELCSVRRTCLVLLEELRKGKMVIRGEAKERAMEMAVMWKREMMGNEVEEEEPLESMGFLNLVAAYGLVGGFSVDEIVDCVVEIANYKTAVELCRPLVPLENMPDVVQKLLLKGKKLAAVKFILESKLTDKFPPVPLLKEYMDEARKLAEQICEKGNRSLQSLNEAAMKEIGASKAVIKRLEDHNLESDYPKEILVMRVKALAQEIAHRKRTAATAAATSNPERESKPQKQRKSKHARTTTPSVPHTILHSVAANSNPPPSQLPHPHFSGLLPDHPAPYIWPPLPSYGFPGPNPPFALFEGSSAGPHGFPRAPFGVPGMEPNLPPVPDIPRPGFFDQPFPYGDYGVQPQHHPSYFPG